MMDIKVDLTKKARQDGIVHKWLQMGGLGTLEACTGFGKTWVGLMAIEHALKTGISSKVIVPTKFLQQQWRDELDEWKLTGVPVEVINTSVKSTHEVGLLVLDEVHKYTAEVFGTIFDRVNYQMILGLTATLQDLDKRNALIYTHAPIIDTVTLKEALDNRWVSAFTIYNYAVEMTGHERDLYKKYSEQFGQFFAFFNHDFDLAMNCLKSNHACEKWGNSTNRTAKEIKIYAVQFVRYMRLRKDMLYGLPSKLEIAKRIVETFPERKVITFSQNVQSAEDLSDLIGYEACHYHSKMKGHIGINGKKLSGTKARADVIERFTTDDFMHRCRVLCTAKALDMGANLPEIDLAIIISGTSAAVQGLQRYGRPIRYIEGKETIIVELYAAKTQDERWLMSRQKKVPKSSIRKISSIDQIR
jgi:RNA polymerase primary sigma factor